MKEWNFRSLGMVARLVLLENNRFLGCRQISDGEFVFLLRSFCCFVYRNLESVS